MQTLYVKRSLLNYEEYISWAKQQGFADILKGEDLHVTIAFSKSLVNWTNFEPATNNYVNESNIDNRMVTPLGDEGAVVLKFYSPTLQVRWRHFINGGCSWDYSSYQPHVSVTYSGLNVDLTKVKPFSGKLIFGPEIFKEVDLNWKAKLNKNE